MYDTIGTVSIALGSVVLDRPDQTGEFFAKDLAGGWAYLVGDAQGDNRFRGQGVCEGGLDLTLRCAFLSAANRVPECGQIRILVDTRQAHRMMVRLAIRDPNVVAAIAGRPVSVMTRPDARSSFQVRSAAERAASVALRNREHAEWQENAANAVMAEAEDAAPLRSASPPVDNNIRAAATTTADRTEPTSGTKRHWRVQQNERRTSVPGATASTDVQARVTIPAVAASSAVRRLVRPLMKGARQGLVAVGMLSPQKMPRSRAIATWLKDLDIQVATIRDDLQEVGI